MTNYDQWQIEKYGNVISSANDSESFEAGIEDLNRLAEWIDDQAELQIMQ